MDRVDGTISVMSAEGVAEKAPIAEESKEAPRRTSPWMALRYRDFRLLWAGGFVSQMGSQMRLVAVGVQLWDLTHSYQLLGLLGLVKLLPLLGFSLFGGVVADALDRRRLLMLTQSVMALTSVVLAVATGFGWISVPLIYAISAISAAATAFDNPARSALIPNLVPRKDLPNALSLNIIMWQMATIIGPTLAGLFVAMHTLGFVVIYWIDAVTFTAVIIALYFLRTRPQQAATRDVSVKAALAGLRFLRKTPIIMSTMVLDFMATFFGAAMVLIPPVAEQILKVDRQYWGVLYAAPAIGAVGAGVVMSWLGNVRHQGLIVIGSVIAYGMATVAFGLSNFY
ncbi:MAG: MFS transporter, partial [Chloroflexia bacterium]